TSVSPLTALALTTLLALGYVADPSSRLVNQAASTARVGGDHMPTQGNVHNSSSAPTDVGALRRGQIPITSRCPHPMPKCDCLVSCIRLILCIRLSARLLITDMEP